MQFKFLLKFLLLTIFISGLTVLDAQVVNTESFDNTTFLPTGWSAVGTTTLWSRRTTGTFPTCTPQSGPGMVRYQSRGSAANTAQTIATPVIDYSQRGSNQAYFSVWIYRDNGSVNGDSLSVYVNTTASLTGATHFGTVARYTKMNVPDTMPANAWYKYTFNVPSGFTGSSNYILIKGVSQNGNNIYIDDAEWNSFPNVCTGTPSPGTLTASPAVICGGSGSSALTLSGYTTGVSGISIQWKVASSPSGPFTNIGGNVSSISTGIISNSQYYKCVVKCANSGLSDSTAVLSVLVKSSALPSIAVNPSPVNYCVGTPARMIATGANSYTWTPLTGLNRGNSDTVYASPNVNTTYLVKGTDTAGCVGQMSVVVSVRQNPNVFISALDTNLCVGDSVLLTAASGGGGNTFMWLPVGKTTSSIYAKPLVSNLYSVTVTNTFGCKGNAKKNINVSQKPVAKFNVNVFARTYRFSDSSINAQELLWDFGDGNFSTSQNPTYTYSEDGMKTITLIARNPPCAADTFTRTFNVSSLAFLSAESGFTLMPNPAKQKLQIELNQNSSFVQVLSLTGQVLIHQDIDNQNTIELDLSHLARGIYFVRTINGMQKLILE